MPKLKKAPLSPWRLAAMMKLREIPSAVALQRLMEKHIQFSYHQARRLVAGDFQELPALETIDALCRVLKCNPDDLIAIAYRSPQTEFVCNAPPSKKWKPYKQIQKRKDTPRQGALTADSLPVEIY